MPAGRVVWESASFNITPVQYCAMGTTVPESRSEYISTGARQYSADSNGKD